MVPLVVPSARKGLARWESYGYEGQTACEDSPEPEGGFAPGPRGGSDRLRLPGAARWGKPPHLRAPAARGGPDHPVSAAVRKGVYVRQALQAIDALPEEEE